MNDYYVIAGNKKEFEKYCLERLHPIDRALIFVSKPETLEHVYNPDGVFYGSWKDRPDIEKILEILAANCREHNKANTIFAVRVKHAEKYLTP